MTAGLQRTKRETNKVGMHPDLVELRLLSEVARHCVMHSTDVLYVGRAQKLGDATGKVNTVTHP